MHFFFKLFLFFFSMLPLLASGQAAAKPEPYPYKLSHELDKMQGPNTPPFYKDKAFQYACIGQYQKALEAWDQFAKESEPLEAAEQEYFEGFSPRDARYYISEAAEDLDILIFNEYRHLPVHRSFTQSMLGRLYTKGYRYLAVDVVPFSNDSINEKRYVNIQTEGDERYLADPLYADLVRRAIRLGYEILPMYVSSKDIPVGEQARAMVRSIHRAVRHDPEAKIIVHTHYPQAMKITPKSWDGTLYHYLQLISTKGVLSIDQANMSEHSQKVFENPYYQLTDLETPSVFLNHTKKPFVEPNKADLFDLQVFHARTRYTYNRPDWMQVNGVRKSYLIDFKRFGISNFPCLVQAFVANETGKYVVPIDQVEVEQGPYYSKSQRKMLNETSLYLPGGRIRLVISSPHGRILHDDFITL